MLGIGVSPGRAVGPVLRMSAAIVEPSPRRAKDPVAEAALIAAAMTEVEAVFRERARRVSGEARDVLEASAQMAADPSLREEAQAITATGEGAERAVWLAVSAFAELLAAQGGRMAERVADLHDLRGRLVAAILGVPSPRVPDAAEPFVLVAHDLAPADTALLDAALCLAIVTEEGGPTSHTAILARGLGIPAVVAARGALDIPEGTEVLVDGTTGLVEANPSTELRATASARTPATPFSGAGRTKDGHAVPLLANVGSRAEVSAAVEANAEGIGLFRTELCFLGRDTAPSVDEQVAVYRPVFAAFSGRKVVVRTLDAGADKPLAFVTDAGEQNPALGIRGIRTSRRHPELLDTQLAAIALAASAGTAQVSVMAPMVATVDEAEEFAARCRHHGLESVGVMIETPAAAVMAQELLDGVDFLSVGTNDLTQYAMAADRLLGELASLNDPWQPAVLRLVRLTAAAGAAASKPVGVCGEAAADPLLAAVLVGFGVSSLSMSAAAFPAVAAELAGVTLDQCQRAATAAAAARSAQDARLAAVSILR